MIYNVNVMIFGLYFYSEKGGITLENLNKKKSLYADLSLALVAIIWGVGFIVIKNALDYIDPLYILAIRFSIASPLMALIFIKRMKKADMSDVKAGAVIGLFLFLAFITQTIGMQYTNVSVSAFITGSNVVIVPFLYWLISKKRPDKFEIIAAILCFIGIGFLSLQGDFSIGLGDGLTMLCALFFACHIVSIGFYSKNHDPIILSVIQFGVAAILSFLVIFIFKINLGNMTMKVGLSMIYLAVVSTIIAFGIQNVAQKYTSSNHAAIILSMESVFGSLSSVIFLDEKFTLRLFLGCVIIFIAIITAETKWSFLKKEKKTNN